MADPYLLQPYQKAAGELVTSHLWLDMKRCLMERRPDAPDPKDPEHVAAAKGHARHGFEQCIKEIEKLPFDHPPETVSPFDRPAISNTED